jgi:hypothetical protein
MPSRESAAERLSGMTDSQSARTSS